MLNPSQYHVCFLFGYQAGLSIEMSPFEESALEYGDLGGQSQLRDYKRHIN
jgi:hypothetical protein